MSLPFGFHIEDLRDGTTYFPGDDPDEDPWYEEDHFDDDPDFVDAGDIHEPEWEDRSAGEDDDEAYQGEDELQPVTIPSTMVSRKKQRDRDQEKRDIARLRAVAGGTMSAREDPTAEFGPEDICAVEPLGTDDAGREVSIVRYNGVIIGLTIKNGDGWIARRIDGTNLPTTPDLHRSTCYLLADHIRSLLESLKGGIERALTTNDPNELMADEVVALMADVEKTAAVVGKAISDYRQIAPADGSSDGLPEDVSWDDIEPPF
jgi:hypothetical protein